MTVRILSTGSHLPGPPLDNALVEQLVGPLPDDVLEGIQVVTRHWMVDPATGEHRGSCSDMAYRAASAALESGGVEAAEVDLVVVSTASPDYLLPPLVTFLQDRLGLERCATLEIRSGCAGTVEALETARLFLETGAFRTALVVGTEAISPLLVPIYRGRDPHAVRMRDRIGAYSFGDGAGAFLLVADGAAGGGAERSSGHVGLRPAALACVGGGRRPGMQIVGGGTATALHEQLAARRPVDLRVDLVESGRFTPVVIAQALPAVLARAGMRVEQVDTCVLPEGNAPYMTEELVAAGLDCGPWSALQPRIVENLAAVGATGSAAVPLAVDAAWRSGRLQPGDEVMLLAIETSKWKYAGAMCTWTAAAPAT